MAVIGSVGVEVVPDARNFVTKLKADIESKLNALSRDLEVTVGVKANTAPAVAEIAALKTKAAASGKDSGDAFSGAFERSLRSSLTRAANALPVIKPGVNATPARLELERLRATLVGLNDEKLHVHPELALKEIAKVKAELAVLAKSGDIDVRVDAHTAHSELTRLESEVSKLGGSTEDVVTQLGGASSKLALIGPAAVGALSLVGPLAAAASGAVIGLAGAAGTAFLAFKGMPAVLKNGSVAAVDFRTEVAGIQTTFERLSETAAKAVLPGINDALRKLGDGLPTLNGLVQELGADLGSAAGHLAGALVGGLRTATPLMQSFGRYLDQGAAALERFSTSDEFKRFVDYAGRELPKIGKALIDATVAGKDVVVALAPLGDRILDGVDNAAQLVSALSHAKDKLDEFKNSDFGALFKGPSDVFGKLLSASPAAALGAVFGGGKGKGGKDDAAAAEQAKALAAATAAQSAAADRQGAALGQTGTAYAKASAAAQAHADSLAATTLQMQIENNVLGLLNQSLDTNAGKQLGVAEATTRLGAANQTTLKALKDNGDTVDENTEKGNANRSAIEGSIEALRAQAQANADAGKSTTEVTAEYNTNKDTLLKQIAATYGANSAVYAYAASLSAIPPVVKTKMEVDTEVAAARLKALNDSISTVQSTAANGAVMNVKVNYTTGSVSTPALGFGGRVDPGFSAAGGYIAGPGTGTSDSIPQWLSNGEFVVNAASTAQYRTLLEQINGGKGSGGGRYATGGMVTAPPASGPRTVVLQVGERQFTAYMSEVADNRVARFADVAVTATNNGFIDY